MKVNALRIRQEFGKVLQELQDAAEPIVIEKGKKPVAVLISMEMFEKRFIDFHQEEKKNKLLEQFRKNGETATSDSLTTLRETRYG